jgi:catechol 2,3-dioxygenase-like lactoylglutathione lyase family enzyme
MSLHGFNHFTIRAKDVKKTHAFYTKVLGLRDGFRPKLANQGWWLYCGVTPIIHLFDAKLKHVYVGSTLDVGDPAKATLGSGSVDHIALSGDDYEGMRRRVEQAGVPYKTLRLPGLDVDQIFVEDPNGLTVEMQFPRDERIRRTAGRRGAGRRRAQAKGRK